MVAFDPITAGLQLVGDITNSITQGVGAHQQRKFQRGQQGKADAYNRKALAQLQALDTYNMDDLYKKLRFGGGEDDLRKFEQGKALEYQMNPDSLYSQLSRKDPLVRQSSDQNLAALSQLRDTGFTRADRSRLQQINNTQRQETGRALGTIERGAIERGANPYTTGILSKIGAAQGAANTANQRGLALDQQAQARQMAALSGIESNIGNRFGRAASVAGAQDRVNAANTGYRNQAAGLNWNRQNSVGDRNTSLQNSLVNRNTDQYLSGRRGVKDSANTKRYALRDGYQHAGSIYQTKSDAAGEQANALSAGAAKAGGLGLGALGGILNEYIPKKKPKTETTDYTSTPKGYGGYTGLGGRPTY